MDHLDDSRGGLIDELESAGASRLFAGGGTAPLDLNDEKNLADLEDANLQAHMQQARVRAAELSAELERLPAPAELQLDVAAASQALSSVASGLSAHLLAIQCATDEIQLAARNAGRLAAILAGAPQTTDLLKWPHGYPAAGPAALLHMENKIGAIAATLGAAVVAIEGLARDHTLTRRLHDQAIEKQKRRCGHYESAYAELIQTLQP